MSTAPIFDRWTPADHLTNTEPRPLTWIPKQDQRRLRFYMVIRALLDNRSAAYATDAREQAERREYGDPDLLVERIVGGILGDDLQIVVDGADTDLPDRPTLPPEPEEPGADASDMDRRVHEAVRRVWEGQAVQAIEQWAADHDAQPALRERQEWLRSWADDELFEAKVYEAERDGAVPLGDGVLALFTDPRVGRPICRVYDPHWYFPVLDPRDTGFPRKLHLAWEEEATAAGGKTEQRVRVLTWELVGLDTVQAPDTGAPVMSRFYPWQMLEGTQTPAPGEKPSDTTCVYSEATWSLDDVNGFPDLSERAGRYETFVDTAGVVRELKRIDLGLDFIPVLHVPNTPSSQDHFGRSAIARVLQLFDDIATVDTDLVKAANLAAGPVVAGDFKISDGERIVIRPGAALSLGPGGKMDVLDLSTSLQPLRDTVLHLLDRLSVNAQVPAEILGRVKGTAEAMSGVALALSFGPFELLIRVLRLVRGPKYALLLKMVQRMAQAAGWLPTGPTPTARLAFGSYLPSDTRTVVELVVKLLEVHGISRRTALQMLTEAGVDVGDVREEIAQVEAEDTGALRDLFDAGIDEAAIHARAGVPFDDTAAAPPVVELPELPQV